MSQPPESNRPPQSQRLDEVSLMMHQFFWRCLSSRRLVIPATIATLNAGCLGPWQASRHETDVRERSFVYLGHQPLLKVGPNGPDRTMIDVSADARCRTAERGDLYRIDRRTFVPGALSAIAAHIAISTLVTGGGFATWKLTEADSTMENVGKGASIVGLSWLGLTLLTFIVSATVDSERRVPTGRGFARWSGADMPCEAVGAATGERGYPGMKIEGDAAGLPVVSEVSRGFASDGLLQVGDRVLRVRGVPVSSDIAARAHIGIAGEGGTVEVTVLRAGVEVAAVLTLTAQPERLRELALKRLEAEQDVLLPALGLPDEGALDAESRARAVARLAEVISGQNPEAFARLSKVLLGDLRPARMHVEVPPTLNIDRAARTALVLPSGAIQRLQSARGTITLDKAKMAHLTTWMNECGPAVERGTLTTILSLPASKIGANANPPAKTVAGPTLAVLGKANAILAGTGTAELVSDGDDPILQDARKCVAKAWSACLEGEVERCDQALRYAPTPEDAEPLETARYHAQRDRCAGNPAAGRSADPTACEWLAKTSLSDEDAAAYRLAARRAEEVMEAKAAEHRRQVEEARRLEAEAEAARKAQEEAELRAQQAQARREQEAQNRADAQAAEERRRDTINYMISGIQQATNAAVAAQTATLNEQRRYAQAKADAQRQREAQRDQARAAERQRQAEAQRQQREQMARQLEKTLPTHQQHLRNAADARSRQVAEARVRAANEAIAALRANQPLPASARDSGLNTRVFVNAPPPNASRTFLSPTATRLDFAPGGNVALPPPSRPTQGLKHGDTTAAVAGVCPGGWEPDPNFAPGSVCARGPCGCRQLREAPVAAAEAPKADRPGVVSGGGPAWVPARGPATPNTSQAPGSTSGSGNGPSAPKSGEDPPLGAMADKDGCWDGLTVGRTPCITTSTKARPGNLWGDIQVIFTNGCDRRLVIEFCFTPQSGPIVCEQQHVKANGRASTGVSGAGEFWLGWAGCTKGSSDWLCIGRAKEHNQGNLQSKPKQR